jgi:hypothetical protein
MIFRIDMVVPEGTVYGQRTKGAAHRTIIPPANGNRQKQIKKYYGMTIELQHLEMETMNTPTVLLRIIQAIKKRNIEIKSLSATENQDGTGGDGFYHPRSRCRADQ